MGDIKEIEQYFFGHQILFKHKCQLISKLKHKNIFLQNNSVMWQNMAYRLGVFFSVEQSIQFKFCFTPL